jgi:hypothetical protein
MEFQDDGGTPAWRQRHQPGWGPQIDVYPNRRAALKAHFQKHPFHWIVLGIWAGLLPWIVFFVGVILLMLYDTTLRIFWSF